ncbi:MAG: hypothetical protein JWP88_1462 [Flaviaesturariibacter sp.]|nr:hypothetical protein [Flaviaesturariibacter sp.]
MKKIRLLILGFLAVLTVSAQKNISFGVKAGISRASINDEDRVIDAKVTPIMGYHIGGLVHIPLMKKLALQPEVVYSEEGAKVDHPTYQGTSKLNYINIPLLIQYIPIGGFRLETGPQAGFLVEQKAVLTATGEIRDKKDVASTNFSWVFGLGYKTRFGFGVDARLNLGLSNLYKKELNPAGSVAKSRVGQLGIFYQF